MLKPLSNQEKSIKHSILRATRRTTINLTLFVLAFSGVSCRQSESPMPIVADCDNTFVARDSSKLQLLEYRPLTNNFLEKASANPERDVIMAAVFHCKSGKLLYGTWRRMTASAKAELHFKSVATESTLQMDQGLNMLIPLQNGEILAETAAVKRSPVDPAIGDLSTEEGARNIPSIAPGQQHQIEGMPVQGQMYLEDVIFDPVSEKEIRRVRGTIGRRELQNGKIVSFAMDQTVYEFDPQTGRRIRIHDYRPVYTLGIPLSKLPLPTYYFSVDGVLYATVGEEKDRNGNSAYLATNRIYKHDPVMRKWQEVMSLEFQPKWATLDADRIIIIGASRIAIFDTKTNNVTTQDMDFGPYEPTSLVRIGGNLALSVAQHAHDQNKPAEDAQIWIVRRTFDRVLLKHPMKNFGVIQLSSQETPLPAAWH